MKRDIKTENFETGMVEPAEENTEALSTESVETSKPKLVRIVNAKRVRFRSTPSKATLTNQIGILDEGMTAEMIGEQRDFVKVKLENGKEGFVAKEFCQEV